MKKYLYIPIYCKIFKKSPFIYIIENYFVDLHNLNSSTIVRENLFSNKKAFIKNYNFIIKKKKFYKKQIINILKKNNLFYDKINCSIDYWLMNFLSILKIRYDKLNVLKKKYKNLHLPSFNFEKFSFDRTEDLMRCFRNDSLNNIYIFQEIAKILRIPLINYGNEILTAPFKSQKFNKNIKFYLLKFLLKIKKMNISANLYNNNNFLSRFIFYYKQNILNITETFLKLPFANSKNYLKFDAMIQEKDIFDKVANKFISDFFPKILCSEEHLKRLFNLQKRIKTLSSSVSLISTEEYRVLTGFLGKKKVFSYQHGSDYGYLKYNLIDVFERSYSTFMSWKKKNSFQLFFNNILQYKKKKLLNISKIKKSNITLFTLIKYNNPLRIETDNINYKSNLDLIFNSSIFFNSLSNKLKKKLVIRNQQHDYGWNYKKYFLKYVSKRNYAKFCNTNSSMESMINSKIFVADHISTSFYEVLQLNIPFFIFFNFKNKLYLTKEENLFLLLKKNNIIFDNPKDCAVFLNNHYDNIEKFWFSKKTQDVLKKVKFGFFKN